MRITLLNQKGGVGKSTVALMLAAVMKHAADYDVAIDDRDPQGTASFYAETLGLPLLTAAPQAGTVITDTPGFIKGDGEASGELRKLITDSDVLVLVAEKSPAAIHATHPMARLIVEHKRPDAKAAVLFNRVRAGTHLGQQSGDELAADLGLPALKTELPLSVAYETALAVGWEAVTGRPRDVLFSLALEVMER